MIKKITLWTLYITFAGLLIFGAIYRTNDKAQENEDPAQQIQASINTNGDANRNGNQQNNPAEQPIALSLPADNPVVPENQAAQDPASHASENPAKWLSLQGVVNSVDESSLVIILTDGSSLEISRRPWRFALQLGFSTAPGNQLLITGFYENSEFKPVTIEDTTASVSVALRDTSGQPLWSGDRE